MAKVLTQESTLSAQSQNLKQESRILDTMAYVELVAGGLIIIGGVLYVYGYGGSLIVPIVGAVILFLGISHMMKIKENKGNVSKIESGRSGEAFVTRLLKEELPDDCFILNDVDIHDGSRNAQNDHLLVSLAGLILIETKAYAGELEGTADDDTWIQTKTRNGRTTTTRLTNPIQQNKYHKEVLERFLKTREVPIESDDIHTFVAMVNKSCTWNISGDDQSVDFAWKLLHRLKKILKEEHYEKKTIRKFLDALNVTPPDQLS